MRKSILEIVPKLNNIMIIDSHTHIFPETVYKDRTPFFENEPEFRLLYDSPKSKISTIAELIRAMDQYKVDVSVICGFPWRDPDKIKKNNDAVISAAEDFPDRIKGLACFNLSWEGAAKEAERCIDAGLCGAGELAFYLSGIDQDALERLEPVMALLREKGNLPCMIHTNEPIGHYYPGKTPVTPEQIYALAQKFPDNRIILAHWGGGIFFYHIMKKQTKQALKNIWYDTAASPFLYEPKIYDIAAAAGLIDKILFGTDFPLLTPERYYMELEQTGLSTGEKAQVLGLNADLLFSA